MLLLSADEGLKVDAIGQRVGCQGQAVRQAIHAFHHQVSYSSDLTLEGVHRHRDPAASG
jgi:hypothetical protein